MKIESLHVDGFGAWTGLELKSLHPGLNVFYGANEAGKSTLLEFLRGALYGFSAERRRYFPPLHGGRPGGDLQVNGPQGRFQIARHDVPDGGARGELILTADDGSRHGEHYLKVLLAEVDESIFNNVFAVGLLELQELATLGDTAAAELLYDLSAGLDRVSLAEVVRALETSREGILSSRGETSQLGQLIAQRDKLRAEIEGLEEQTRHYGRLVVERQEVERDVARLESEKQRVERQLRTAEAAASLRERWRRREELDRRLAAWGPAARMPEGALARWETLTAKLRKKESRLEDVARRERPLQTELESLRVNESLERQSARIEALREQQGWLKGLADQTAALTQEVAALQSQIGGEYQQLGLPAPNGSGRGALDAAAGRRLETLRPLAKTLREASARAAEAKQKCDSAQEVVRAFTQQLESALAAHGETSINTAMQRASEQVTLLRQRLAADDRLEALTRNLREAEAERHELLGQAMLPMPAVLVVGGIFMVSAALLVLSVFTGWWWGLFFGVLGVAGAVFAGAAKVFLERTTSNRLDECEEQIDRLRVQIRQAKLDREALDKQIPSGGGPLAARLDKAEKQLAAFEELVPLDQRCQTAAHNAEAAKQQAEQAAGVVSAARRRWREGLQAARLPENFHPRQIRQWSAQSDHLLQLHRRLEMREEELKQQRAQYDGLAGRIRQMLVDCGLEVRETEPLGQLKALCDAAVEQETRLKRREELRRDLRRLRRQRAKCDEGLAHLKSRRRRLLRDVGLKNEKELRELTGRQAEFEDLRRERETVGREIAAVLGDQISEEAVAALLENPLRLETTRGELAEALAAVDRQLPERFERRGRMAEQLRAMLDDRRLAARRLDLGVVEQRIAEAAARWQVHSVANQLVESARLSYEQQRQPESLQEASRYLSRLTRGHFRRVWTPLGEQSLRVDDDEGRSWSVEQLSRGAREQLFLALRLALVSAYARQGKSLPIVLDDVLVNFDADRAQAAADLLQDYAAEGRQLLVFTCHEHVFQMFHGEGLATFRLPQRGRSATPEPTPEAAPRRRGRKRPDRKVEPTPAIESPPVVEEPLVEEEWEEARLEDGDELEQGLWEEEQAPAFAEDDDEAA